MEFVNLTPHAISIFDADGNVMKKIEPSGTIARLSTSTETVDVIDGIRITATVFGDIEGLPSSDPNGNVGYIVSSLVAQAVDGRSDIFIPNESVRDSQGRIIGCKSLGRI